jgi:hypothetical protein
MATTRRRRSPQTAAEAITSALDSGIEVKTTTASDGETLHQRPFDLGAESAAKAPPAPKGERVRVYHKHNRTMALADGEMIGPHEEKEVSLKSATHPRVAPHLVMMR